MAGPGGWSFERNKKFEKALAIYGDETPERWSKIVAFVGGGATVPEVKARYQILLDDISNIESGKIPLPHYNSNSSTNTTKQSNAFATDMAASDFPFKIILGSSSMARRKILAEMGYEFTIMSADIDEKSIRREKPEELVTALAEAKADAVISKLNNSDALQDSTRTTLLITADTVVVYEGMIREKPRSEDEAREFIKGYSGGHAAVVGAIVVTNLETGTRKGGWEKAEVYFHEIPSEVIDSLIDEGVTYNVAGGLMLEHPLTWPCVEAVVGAADTVMGLSKALTERLMQEVL